MVNNIPYHALIILLSTVLVSKSHGNESAPFIFWERESLKPPKILTMTNSAQVSKVHMLNVSGIPIGDEEIDSLILEMKNLTSLDVSGTKCSTHGVMSIATHLIYLKTLDISYLVFKKTAAKAIGQELTQLENLTAVGCKLRSGACYHLLSKMKNLKRLNLAYNHLQEEGLEGIIHAPHPNLSSLNLESTQLQDRDIMKLFSTSWFKNLKELNLSRNYLTTYSIDLIARQLVKVEVLNLSYLNLMNKQAILISENLLQLHRLNLAENQIKFKGIKALLKAPLTKLEFVDVSFNFLENKEIKYLKKYNKKQSHIKYVYEGEARRNPVNQENHLTVLEEEMVS